MKVMQAKHGKLPYIVVEDSQGNVFIVFSGSNSEGKLENFLEIFQKSRLVPEIGGCPGRYHAGILNKAKSFPMRTVLSRERYIKIFLKIYTYYIGNYLGSNFALHIILYLPKYQRTAQ